MGAKPLRQAMLAAALCLSAIMVAPSASAATCPRSANQTFSGTLMPKTTDSYSIVVPARGNVSFQFVPMYPFWGPAGQTVRMSVGGSSITGIGSLAISFGRAPAGVYVVHLRGLHLGVDGLSALPYKLVVAETNCIQ